jgi:hypothetical protein
MFNPGARIRLVAIPGQLPCVVIDDFLLNPDTLVAEAVRRRSSFAPAPRNAFPGLELRMPDEFSARLDEFFMLHIRARLGARRTSGMFSRLSMVSTPPGQLRPLQRVCHHDNYASAPSQCFPALVLYLFQDPELGGTSFYRPRQSQADTHALLDAWAGMTDDDFTRLTGAAPAYLTASNDHFELVATIPAAYNRAIFYDGAVFHSSHITAPQRLSDDPATGRLTLNGFWICRKAAGA